MPVEHVVSLEYLICFIVLHCVLAAFCQLLLNEYCIVLYVRKPQVRSTLHDQSVLPVQTAHQQAYQRSNEPSYPSAVTMLSGNPTTVVSFSASTSTTSASSNNNTRPDWAGLASTPVTQCCKFASVMWRGNPTIFFLLLLRYLLAYYLFYFPYWPSDYYLSETYVLATVITPKRLYRYMYNSIERK